MTTAVFTSAPAGDVRTSSKLSLLAKRFIHALAESRARDALRELHRHEALLKDLGRRQDHSWLFLMQDDGLPVKI
jgi:hypothetical protein